MSKGQEINLQLYEAAIDARDWLLIVYSRYAIRDQYVLEEVLAALNQALARAYWYREEFRKAEQKDSLNELPEDLKEAFRVLHGYCDRILRDDSGS